MNGISRDERQKVHESLLFRYLGRRGFPVHPAPDVTCLEGSSAATTFRIKLCAKLGDKNVIDEELYVYRELRHQLNESYSKVFPRYEVVEGGQMVFIEYLGDSNLEDFLLADGTSFKKIQSLFVKVLDNLQIMSSYEKPKDITGLVQEILSSLQERVGHLYPEQVQRIRDRFENLNLFYKSTLCHRDLSVGNVMVSDDMENVRFIDPSFRIPDARVSAFSSGSIFLDGIAFEVSVMHKILEKSHLRSEIFVNDIFSIILDYNQSLIEKGFCSFDFGVLARVCYYGMYVGCDCDYCLAPKRKHVWEAMKAKFENYLEILLGKL